MQSSLTLTDELGILESYKTPCPLPWFNFSSSHPFGHSASNTFCSLNFTCNTWNSGENTTPLVTLPVLDRAEYYCICSRRFICCNELMIMLNFCWQPYHTSESYWLTHNLRSAPCELPAIKVSSSDAFLSQGPQQRRRKNIIS